ncbi:MAG: leucine-rich repeat domain-containing protein [Candidatus Hodarchaeales archaeon]
MEGEKNPKVLLESFRSGELDEEAFSDALILIIEKSDDILLRVEGFELLCELGFSDSRIVKFLQDLLLSDLDEGIRVVAAREVGKKFLAESLSVVGWVLEKESSIDVISPLLESLKKFEPETLRNFLQEVFENIISGAIPSERCIKRTYILVLTDLFKDRNIEEFSVDELIEIYVHYKVLLGLEERYHLDANNCHQIIENGLVYSLDLSGLGIESISEVKVLKKLSKLESLDLTGNRIKEISGLEIFTILGYLNLSHNQIKEIKGLEKAKTLQTLNLTGNCISEIKGLDNLIELELLCLGENQIKEIKGLKKLRKLHELSLEENQIFVVKDLLKLKNLQHLTLIGNPIKKIKRGKKLKKMKFKDDLVDLIE